MALALALLVQSLLSLTIFAPLLLAPLILSTLGLSAQWAGTYMPLAFSAAIVGSSLSGRLISQFGPWRLSLYCMALMGAGAAVFAVATLPAATAGTLIMGLSYGPIPAAGSSILMQSGTRNLSLRMSIRQAGVPLGASIGAFVLPPLCQTFGWPSVWAGMGACFVVLAGAFGYSIPIIRAEARQHPPAPMKTKMRPLRLARDHTELRPVAFLFLVYASVQTCFSSFLSLYLVDFLHLDLRHAGILLGIGSALGMMARVAWGFVADRWGTLVIVIFIGVMMTVSSVLTGLLSSTTPFMLIAAAIALFGSTATGWNGVMFARAAQLAPEGQVGGVTGEMAVFAYLGFILAAPVFSILIASVTIAYAYIVTGLACGLSVAIFAYLSLRSTSTLIASP